MRRHFQVAVVIGALALPVMAAHAQDKASQRGSQRQASSGGRSSGGGGGERAVPRSAPATRAESPRSTTRATPSSRGSDRATPASSGSARSGRGSSAAAGGTGLQATPRDRGDRQSFGTATPRHYPNYPGHYPGHGGGYYPGWDHWYYPYYPLAYGFFWNPWVGYGYPYGYGYGAGYGYVGAYGGYGAYAGPTYQIYGGLRLKVQPRNAEVFVDGYFAGIVDDFDGAFQQLNLDTGPHRIELRAAGYESVSFEIRTQPDEKITYKTALKPIP